MFFLNVFSHDDFPTFPSLPRTIPPAMLMEVGMGAAIRLATVAGILLATAILPVTAVEAEMAVATAVVPV